VTPMNSNDLVSTVKKLLTPYDLGYTKIRIGPKEDGGYVFYKDMIEKTEVVYSFGVGWVWGCDLEFANMGKIVHMYDKNDFTPNHKNMKFKKAFITSALVNEDLREIKDNNLLMCMDIEGCEYEVLLNLDKENLLKFSQISLEIHGAPDSKNLIPLLERLNENYSLFHVHANNYSGFTMNFPQVLELSFLRKDLEKIKKVESNSFPIKDLDYPNNPSSKDYVLDWLIN